MAPGTVVAVDQTAPKLRTGPLAESAIVFYDRDLVVVDKPAGMLSVADESGNKETIADYARTLLRRIGAPGVDSKLGVVHRLDKDTSGVMVFARTATAKRALAAQFRAHTVDRVYHAIAHGAVIATRVETYLLLDRGDGIRGSYGLFRRPNGDVPIEAKRSVTHIRPIACLVGATLVECRLEAGSRGHRDHGGRGATARGRPDAQPVAARRGPGDRGSAAGPWPQRVLRGSPRLAPP